MNREKILGDTEKFVRKELAGAEGGHDWWHTLRVRNLAKKISLTENCDPFVVEMGALLHDIADSKFHGGDEGVGPEKARDFLRSHDVEEQIAEKIVKIIENVSFKGGGVSNYSSPELQIVQDADRLDAIGAIGIARTFNYGGFRNRELYNPDIPPNLNMTKEEYKNSTAPTINHFYEKLLLLRDRMNTRSGKRMAGHRHAFLESFLGEFYLEWDGEK